MSKVVHQGASKGKSIIEVIAGVLTVDLPLAFVVFLA